MTKPRKMEIKAQTPEMLTVAELQKKLAEAQQKEIEEISKKIETIETEHAVGIGVQLNIRKLQDVIAYMIANNKQVISLKFEVWKNKSDQ
jgi:hypothetical protein